MVSLRNRGLLVVISSPAGLRFSLVPGKEMVVGRKGTLTAAHVDMCSTNHILICIGCRVCVVEDWHSHFLFFSLYVSISTLSLVQIVIF